MVQSLSWLFWAQNWHFTALAALLRNIVSIVKNLGTAYQFDFCYFKMFDWGEVLAGFEAIAPHKFDYLEVWTPGYDFLRQRRASEEPRKICCRSFDRVGILLVINIWILRLYLKGEYIECHTAVPIQCEGDISDTVGWKSNKHAISECLADSTLCSSRCSFPPLDLRKTTWCLFA